MTIESKKAREIEKRQVTLKITPTGETCPSCGGNIIEEKIEDAVRCHPPHYHCDKCEKEFAQEFCVVETLSEWEIKFREYIKENGNVLVKMSIAFHNGDIVPDLNSETEIKNYECDCGEEFDEEEGFTDHVREEHMPVNPDEDDN